MPLGLLLCLCLIGCSPKSYFKNRGRDFLDIVSADVSGGLGMGVHARAAVIHTGLGAAEMWHVGLQEKEDGTRNAPGVRLEAQQDFLLWKREMALSGWDAHLLTPGTKAPEDLHFCLGMIHLPGRGEHGRHIASDTETPWLDTLDLNLGVNVFFVGARAGLRPGQFLDFLLGWFGVDLGKDDEPEPSAPEPPG